MATTTPVHPPRKHWMARHKVWTAALIFVVIAIAVGLVFCGPW